jgi:conjugal transfer pilus assembly protein TraF
MRAVFSVQYSVFRNGFKSAFIFSSATVAMLSHLSCLKAEDQSGLKWQQQPLSTIELKDYTQNHLNHRVKAQPSGFFEKRAEGWHWYESLRKSKTEEEKIGYGLSPSSAQTPTEKIEAQRKQLETKLHTAILEPNRENIITYILAQKALMDQSQRFSEAWKQVVLTTPSLDETLIHPVNQSARHVYYDEQKRSLSKKIHVLSQEYGLFFFFRQNCRYCHHFAPIVKRFAEKYGWSVLGISLDGGSLPEFPHAKRDNGIVERLGITHVPALITLHPKSGKLIPLAYGMISEGEIEERVEFLTQAVRYEGAKK